MRIGSHLPQRQVPLRPGRNYYRGAGLRWRGDASITNIMGGADDLVKNCRNKLVDFTQSWTPHRRADTSIIMGGADGQKKTQIGARPQKHLVPGYQ